MTVNEICEILSEVGLCAREYIDREINGSLSGGELKRIEIAMITARIVPYVLREAVDGRYEERILRDIQNGITLEKLNMRKRKKTPEEKAAVLKMKRKQRRAKSRL